MKKNFNYSNKNIDKEKSYLNYALKESMYSYEKEFDRLKEKYDLKGQIKTVSNIACEYIITSDKEFFEEIGEEETNRQHLDIKEYKELTNFNVTKEFVKSITLDIPEETNINDLKKIMFNKNEKISNRKSFYYC